MREHGARHFLEMFGAGREVSESMLEDKKYSARRFLEGPE